MSSKRERYERANMRGGLGVRKRLSEESLRETYRLNGVQTGSVVARAWDKYRGDFSKGYDLGMIVRKTSSVVQIHWLGDEDITSYSQGDARYEADRGRWKFLGPMQGNPLDPTNPLADALTALRQNARIQASANAGTPPTEGDEDMAKQQSKAAEERAAAKKQLENGDLKERETYTAKQVATRCGTDSKTMRKFFRSNHSTVEPVGQGGRYEFDARDFPKIKREFDAWQAKAKARQTKPAPKLESQQIAKAAQDAVDEDPDDDITMEQVAAAIERAQDEEESPWEPHPGLADIDPDEPSPEELAELEGLELDLDDMDED